MVSDATTVVNRAELERTEF